MALRIEQLEKKVVDQQLLVFPTPVQWGSLLQDPILDGRAISKAYIDGIKFELPYILKYSELLLGIGDCYGRWATYVLLNGSLNLQRVFLETLQCLVCQWKGVTANPKVSDIYLGVPKGVDEFELMRFSNNYPILNCPVCNSKLPRHPIWIEH